MAGTIFMATMDFLRPKHSQIMPDKKHPNGCAMKEMLAVNCECEYRFCCLN